MGFCRENFRKAALPLLIAAALLPPAAYELPHAGWINSRFADCIAQQAGGKASTFGTVRDLDGQLVVFDPVLKTYGTELAGRRPGIIVNNLGNSDKLTFVLTQEGGMYKGHWDFVRVAGQPLPAGSWGRGDVFANVQQRSFGAFAEMCANNPWVTSNATRRLPLP